MAHDVGDAEKNKLEEQLEFYQDANLLGRLVVGIGEVAEITGVPQRQLRYWQDKGIIFPTDDASSVRRYDYVNIKKILMIKELLDEGYSLDAAAAKVEKRAQNIAAAFRKLSEQS
jgi:DNA-binding transcriptional MerR regulator